MGSRSGFLALEPGRSAIDTHRFAIVTLAILKHTSIVVRRHVPGATHDIVDVLAKSRSVGSNAGTEAKLIVGDEVGPFMVLEVGTEATSIDETTDGVAETISTVRVELSSIITSRNVHAGEVTDTSNLNIMGSLDKVDTFQRPIWNKTSSTARFGAIRDFDAFGITNGTRGWRRPDAKVFSGVDPSRLAHAVLGRLSATVVNTSLTVLGGLREVIGRVSDVPELVSVASITAPELRSVSIICASIGQIEALSVVGPCEVKIARVVELLVGVTVV